MGGKNGVQYFRRNSEVSLEKVRDIARGVVDDILIGSDRDGLTEDTVEKPLLKHDQEIRKTLDELRKHQLVASKKRAQFFQKRGTFVASLCRMEKGKL